MPRPHCTERPAALPPRVPCEPGTLRARTQTRRERRGRQLDQSPTSPTDEGSLGDWLARHDEPCPVCAYNLRGVRAAACPECNAPLTLGVRSPSAIAGPWALALIAFSLALGFDAVTSLLLLAPLIGTRGDPIAIAMWTTMATLGVCSGIGVAWMLTRRRVWMRMRARTQWRAAWTIFFGVGLLHAAVGGAWVLLMVL